MAESVDLNGDVGEHNGSASTNPDAAFLPHLTSANIACGAHAGSPAVMRQTVRLALEHRVAIGAHPSFVDREHFGRRELLLPPSAIEALVSSQIGALAAIAAEEGAALNHVKPHGALYNMAARDPVVAEAIAAAVHAASPQLILFGLAGSRLIEAGSRAGLRTASEVFADRAYRPDGSLVPRSEPGAVLHDPEEVAAHALALVTRRTVRADTICLHGDTPGAAALAARVRRTLEDAGIRVTPLAR
jgi:UPF0271 protein